MTLWIGAYALVFGALMAGLGFRLRGILHRGEQTPRPHLPAPV